MPLELLKRRIPASQNSPELELVLAGELPRVLFVHGANCNAAVWRQLMVALGERRISSAALDLRGHGNSNGKEELQRWGIEDYVEDVLKGLAYLSYPPVVIGHSMGGLVSQLVAERTSLAGLGLIASSPVNGMRKDGFRMFIRHPVTFFGALGKKSFAHLYRNSATCRSLLFCRHTPDAVIVEFMSSVQEESWRAGNQMNSLLPSPVRVKCPVLVIGGSEDFMVSAQSVHRTAKAYHTKPVFMAKVGHMVQLECKPAELASVLEQFVARAVASSLQRTAEGVP